MRTLLPVAAVVSSLIILACPTLASGKPLDVNMPFRTSARDNVGSNDDQSGRISIGLSQWGSRAGVRKRVAGDARSSSPEGLRHVQGLNGKSPVSQALRYEYVFVANCPNNSPNGARDNLCLMAYSYCQDNDPDGSGPWSTIYRRRVPAAEGDPWETMGTTCFPERDARAVGVAPRPRVTLAMIRAAWRDTPFAKPMAVIQPPGNRTLVNIPTYFQASWPTAGYAPQEINTVTLLGQRVRIRPTLEHFTYSYGDGQTLRTTSAGGGYPDGDVQHTYVKKGIRTVRIDATYGGEFSLDGGEWAPIDGTVTIPGPARQLTVLTAKNRLLIDPGERSSGIR